MKASQTHPLVVFDDDAQTGVAWVAARGAVSEEAENLQAITRIRPQLSQ
jgi:hypothetical protein